MNEGELVEAYIQKLKGRGDKLPVTNPKAVEHTIRELVRFVLKNAPLCAKCGAKEHGGSCDPRDDEDDRRAPRRF